MDRSNERINASPRQKRNLGTCPLFTPPEGNWLSVDIQGEAQCRRHRQLV